MNILYKKYTFSSHNKGRCKTISKGSVSAAIIINSDISRFRDLVVSFAPFFTFYILTYNL